MFFEVQGSFEFKLTNISWIRIFILVRVPHKKEANVTKSETVYYSASITSAQPG